MNKYLIWLLITLGLLWAAINLSSCTLMEMLRDQDRARTKAIRLFTPNGNEWPRAVEKSEIDSVTTSASSPHTFVQTTIHSVTPEN